MQHMKDRYSLSRKMYLCEAALEYMISLMVTGSFLATIAADVGASDSLTGIISSLISLGCVFQAVSPFLFRGGSVKKAVILLSIVNQLLFTFLYVIPLLGGSPAFRQGLLIGAMMLAYMTYHVICAAKINWFMSLVDDEMRGRFTANKEMISLAAGMAFSFGMGAWIDYYRDRGELHTAFLLCAGMMLLLTLLHTVTMCCSREKTMTANRHGDETKPLNRMLAACRSRDVIRVTIVFLLWNAASNVAIPFYGTYLIKELEFSLTFVSVLGILYSLVRIAVSRFWGSYADKKSFASMIRVCFLIAAIGFFINIFTVPSNGAWFYTLHYICYAVAMGGINSALTNLIFDYVAPEMRTDALAINQAVSGLFGFLATVAVSPLVGWIQRSENHLFGLHVYAQQVVSLLAFLLTVAAILYVRKALPGKRKEKLPETEKSALI